MDLKVGIDIGSTTVKVVVMKGKDVLYRVYQRHLAQVRQAALEALQGAKEFLNDPFKVAIHLIVTHGLVVIVQMVKVIETTYK